MSLLACEMTESIKELMKKELRYQWQPPSTGTSQSLKQLPTLYSISAHKRWREHICEWMYKVSLKQIGKKKIRLDYLPTGVSNSFNIFMHSKPSLN